MKNILKTNKKLLSATLAFILAFALIGTDFFGALSTISRAADDAGILYYSDYNSLAEANDACWELNEEIAGEGFTLLKNDNVLPFSSDVKKVSVFGKSSVNPVYGGTGSGGVARNSVTVKEGLMAAGFQSNPTLEAFYGNNSLSGNGRGGTPSSNPQTGVKTGETPVGSYTATQESSYIEYGDAALIIFSRMGGEGWDLPTTSFYNGADATANSQVDWSPLKSTPLPGARKKDDHYLQLDKNESDLIHYVCRNFDKVVLVINCSNAMELGFLDDPGHYAYNPKLKGAIWIGGPGANGFTALGSILNGTVNPSGKIVDTYARDFTNDPTFANFGNNGISMGNSYRYTDADLANGVRGIYTNSNGDTDPNRAELYYVEYEEGIYLGYRYYETRGFTEGSKEYTSVSDWNRDGFVTSVVNAENYRYNTSVVRGTETTTWDNWYKAHVVYPFGYGLSYTTFNWEIIGSVPANNALLAPDGKVSVTVRVTNTGNRAGKEVVQLYNTAPYTPGEIEKAYVSLVGFAKTGMIEPGKSEDVTVEFSVRDLASYDFTDANENGFTGFEAEEGEYEIKVMRNSHELVDSVKFNIPAGGFKYDTSEVTGKPIKNLFDDVSNLTNNLPISETSYLSRNDWKGTWPKPPTVDERTVGADYLNTLRYCDDIHDWMYDFNNDTPDKPWYSDTLPKQAPEKTTAKSDIQLIELAGLDYDDPKWDKFMDGLMVSELAILITEGHFMTYAISRIGKPKTMDNDGPAGIKDRDNILSIGSWTAQIVIAATWNTDLAYRMGRIVGNQGLLAGVQGWYAPGANAHRSPFGARNFEYYSEDGIHGGTICGYVTRGCQDKGTYVYLKHYALNDQDSNRNNNAEVARGQTGYKTYASEQAMRENILRHFELGVKIGGARGIMAGHNSIGAVPCPSSYALCTGILREEWGFQGMVITDLTKDYETANDGIRAGYDISLNAEKKIVSAQTGVRNGKDANKDSAVERANRNYDKPYNLTNEQWATQVTCMRRAAKNILFVTGNSHVMNLGEKDKNGKPIPVGTVKLNDKVLIDGKYEELPHAGIEQSYIQKLEATLTHEGAEPVTFKLHSGKLPEGLTLGEDGTISGAPTEKGSYAFKIAAYSGEYARSIADFSMTVGFAYPNRILSSAMFGQAYSISVATAVGTDGNDVAYFLKDYEGLPAGLRFNPETNMIEGTPAASGTYTFRFGAAMENEYAEAEFTLVIGLSHGQVTATQAVVGQTYGLYVAKAAGGDNITYALKTGSVLPDGLTLSKDGIISGVPLEAGSVTLTIIAAASNGGMTEFTITINVKEDESGGETEKPKPGCGSVMNVSACGVPAIALFIAGLAVIAFITKRSKGNA